MPCVVLNSVYENMCAACAAEITSKVFGGIVGSERERCRVNGKCGSGERNVGNSTGTGELAARGAEAEGAVDWEASVWEGDGEAECFAGAGCCYCRCHFEFEGRASDRVSEVGD
jgi:hypothetical protein